MFPDFLCIGAKRAATSWLRRNLMKHPDTCMPPVKEIRYFNDTNPCPNILTAFHRDHGGKRMRDIVRSHLLNPGTISRRKDLLFGLRFLFPPRSDKWYASLFTPVTGQVAGDVTPAYALLSPGKVARLHSAICAPPVCGLHPNPHAAAEP